ncbi:MAG TPA: phosphomannomutase/phosphoglucomutase [Candidatus Moranbacteria bacterium]|nr:phosphomannomutase/phosphoglucomutase [Candidatus Moranbacteria bacterium]HRY28375.1 phosphomannomutase/phosphoglucomutase [Candidatus Moranbacteria bacterium]HSA08047.1 phosphomannomutase/phosphoglucomutase [Candidatus Moranbacteria bacterium]
MNPGIFKAYDIRGIYPSEINEQDAYKIAKAYCKFVKPSEVVIGSDVRLSSPSLKKAAIKAVTDQGIKVIDVGEISTDMLYFAVANYGYAGGFSLTASHNPKEYNGAKFVREESRPISSDTGLFEIRDIAMQDTSEISNFELTEENLKLIEKKNIMDDYINKIKTFADFSKFKKFKIVANPNFGVAGRAIDRLLENSDIEVVKLNWESDGNFPKGRPDPLIPENREEISKLVVENGADFGVAWDADADRCFFFTEKGEFIEGYFITALLGKIFLERTPGATILHDPRLVWAIQDIAKENGGSDIMTKSGHAFIKERMRKENVVFGGEMSAHYYFKDYFFCDNGLIPFVMMLEFLSTEKKTLSEIMTEMFWNKYFVSGEINSEVSDVKTKISEAKSKYSPQAKNVDETDGVSIEFEDWRFNLRGSNTEPVIRLNVEAKTKERMEEKRDELLEIIRK